MNGLSAYTMRYWVTPFPLSAEVCSFLAASGLQPWHGGESSLPEADALLLYDSPDQLIAMAGTGPDKVEINTMVLTQGYRRLLGWSERTGQPLLSISRLQRLGPHKLRAWFADGDIPSLPPGQSLPIPPLLAAVTLSLLEAEPALLDCYSDLELRAVLLGRDPDTRYYERLRDAIPGAEVLLQAFLTSQSGLAAATELQQRLASIEIELQEAREAAELSLLQLQQVQEELEHYFLADKEKQRQLEVGVRKFEELRRMNAAQVTAHELELKALRERLEPRLAELEQRLANRDTELKEAREAGELSLLQLHQGQEELELYFLKARASDQLVQAQFAQLQRAQDLMLRLQSEVIPTSPCAPALAVETLTAVVAETPNPTLQTKALLDTYAASLQRAIALLDRARRS